MNVFVMAYLGDDGKHCFQRFPLVSRKVVICVGPSSTGLSLCGSACILLFISTDIKDVELILTRLVGSINFADRLVQSAGDSDLVSVAKQTIDHCEKLQKLKIENKRTEVLEWDFDKADHHSAEVGGLKVKVTLPLSHYTKQR